MRTFRSVVFFGLVFSGAAAVASSDGLVPLEPGIYVRNGASCRDAPFASILEYDGHAFAGPHASQCTSTVLSRRDATYTLTTTCDALGDGSAATAYTEIERVTVLSRDAATFAHRADKAVYRRCSRSDS